MRMLFVLAAVGAMAMATQADVWPTVYRYDEKTPLEAVDPNVPATYRDIMMGTHLTIVISSDQAGYWYGSLQLPLEGDGRGSLKGRGLIARPLNYQGSCLPAAGDSAEVFPYLGLEDLGFEFYSSYDVTFPGVSPSVPGDWFIFDYYATRVGPFRVELYDLLADPMAPLETLSFTHVPSRDFNADNVVDLRDFALLALRWQDASSDDPTSPDAAMDFDADRAIDVNDLTLFSDFWLERTDAPKLVADPNEE